MEIEGDAIDAAMLAAFGDFAIPAPPAPFPVYDGGAAAAIAAAAATAAPQPRPPQPQPRPMPKKSHHRPAARSLAKFVDGLLAPLLAAVDRQLVPPAPQPQPPPPPESGDADGEMVLIASGGPSAPQPPPPRQQQQQQQQQQRPPRGGMPAGVVAVSGPEVNAWAAAQFADAISRTATELAASGQAAQTPTEVFAWSLAHARARFAAEDGTHIPDIDAAYLSASAPTHHTLDSARGAAAAYVIPEIRQRLIRHLRGRAGVPPAAAGIPPGGRCNKVGCGGELAIAFVPQTSCRVYGVPTARTVACSCAHSALCANCFVIDAAAWLANQVATTQAPAPACGIECSRCHRWRCVYATALVDSVQPDTTGVPSPRQSPGTSSGSLVVAAAAAKPGAATAPKKTTHRRKQLRPPPPPPPPPPPQQATM